MKLTFAVLLMTTTLGAGPTVLAAGPGLPPTPGAGLTFRAPPGTALTLIDDDDDGDEGKGKGGWLRSLSDDEDDDDDGEDDCDDEDGDDCAGEAVGSAAKAGRVAPPKNGLFSNGTAPVVTSN